MGPGLPTSTKRSSSRLLPVDSLSPGEDGRWGNRVLAFRRRSSNCRFYPSSRSIPCDRFCRCNRWDPERISELPRRRVLKSAKNDAYCIGLDARDFKSEAPNLKHQATNIKAQDSNINGKPKTSNLKHQIPNIKAQVSNIEVQVSKSYFFALRGCAGQPAPRPENREWGETEII
jgi:hypothetical protein